MGWGGRKRPGHKGLECPVYGPRPLSVRPLHQAGSEMVRPVAQEDHLGTFKMVEDH